MEITREQIDGIWVVRMAANLDAANAPEMRKLLGSLAAEENLRLILDLSRTEFIDSAGVGVIVKFYQQTRDNRGGLCFCGVKGQPLSLLHSLKVDEVIPFHPTFSDAAASLQIS